VDPFDTLVYAVNELHGAVASIDADEMGIVTNCAPWTVRQLASHALNNQLLWAGLVADEHLVSMEETMAGVPREGDLVPIADDVVAAVARMWATDGVMERVYATPFGELPGSVVILFPTVDAAAHSWDLAISLRRPFEFAPEATPAISAVVGATCTDVARDMGLIRPPTTPPDDATATEGLMALAGRTIPRPHAA
jgi:uncharacterized protein (TIGR03086 family)